MRTLLAAILLLCGCGIRPAERLDGLFDAATDDLHTGELAKALLATDHGIAVSGSRHDRRRIVSFTRVGEDSGADLAHDC